jgi:addiction module HigA family antidote
MEPSRHPQLSADSGSISKNRKFATWIMRITNKGENTMRMLNPPHPGDFIRTEIIIPTGLSVTAAVKVLGVSRPTLSSLLNGKADLSGDMALRVEKAFGVKMDTLMRMQASYDIALTRKRQSAIKVVRYRPEAVYH